ncbi:MAG TPA: RICIN domain-containing protein [Micromonosporaceae bacterium]|nr:RICIN domain-containing protein [Micromonosporaceae bacterium]
MRLKHTGLAVLVIAAVGLTIGVIRVADAATIRVDTPTYKATDFEDSQLSPYSVCTTQSPNYGRVESIAGTRAAKFYWTQAGYNGTRMDRGAEACSDLKSYKAGWYGFKFRLPSTGFPRDKYTIIAQIFNEGGCSSWAGTLAVENNELWFDHRGACGTATRTRLDTNIPRDTWLPITMQYIVSKANAGQIGVWYNGAPQDRPTYRATNINFASWGTYAGDQLAAQTDNHIGLKFGMYCADTAGYTPNESRVLYFDDVKQLAGNPADAFQLVNPSTEVVPTTPAAGTVKLVNRSSGKVLAPSGNSAADGAAIVQTTDTGNASQQWRVADAGGGYVKLVNRANGKLLDVGGRSILDGAAVLQYSDTGGTNQHWQVVTTGGHRKLVNRNSGKVLDVTGASTADGTAVIQWSDNGGANQQWTLAAG